MTLFQKLVLGARVLLGLIFFVSGIIGLLKLAPFPAPTPQAGKFIDALIQTGYLFPAVMAIQTACGLLLILGFFVPLVLLMLAPIIVNIVLYQVFLNLSPIGLLLGCGPLLLEAGLAYLYRSAFLALFQIRTEPS
ncbi:MAG: DoxX family membrane protein [SAR324 cluster bacterium]